MITVFVLACALSVLFWLALVLTVITAAILAVAATFRRRRVLGRRP